VEKTYCEVDSVLYSHSVCYVCLFELEMFKTIFESFLKPEPARLETKVLNLELLSYNFYESLNLKPLFVSIERQICEDCTLNVATKSWYRNRLYKVAREINRKQIAVLEINKNKFDSTIELNEDFLNGKKIIELDEFSIKLNNNKKRFMITVLEADTLRKEIKVRMEVRSSNDGDDKLEVNVEFWISFFDFPMIDNTRLSHDYRCAIVMNDFFQNFLDITVLFFPGSRASLKEKPYYQEIIENLLPEKTDYK